MEGLLDWVLRDILTRAGGVDRCVSEFIRVTGTLLPNRLFRRVIPELDSGARTPAGVPVRAQLLGSDPVCMAENAAKLAALGPAGIDLNFGCPAKVVNRHRGGAVLLDEPELIHRIVVAVRQAVPRAMPVSAKMRLGNADGARAVECAVAMASGGAEEIVVHARTKADGYRPPAYWDRIRTIRESAGVPVIANGEIWTVDDAIRCREMSGCDDLMLGRGIVADPGLALAIRARLEAPWLTTSEPLVPWPALLPLLADFWHMLEKRVEPRHRAGRLKQWLHLLRRRFPEAEAAFACVRPLTDVEQVGRLLAGAFDAAATITPLRAEAV
ncbi:MAG: tRNA dihydrouridine(16) synthase DusC [Betaproteobacteria bacterium]|nr:tRNA dihydrouridine(16) synthase DusC [Betaproteobacteria bacterium]